MGVNSIRLAKQTIKSSFNTVLLRVVYNTNRPLNGFVKHVTPLHELTNLVYAFSCHCRNDCVGRTSQHFHVRREQHVTKRVLFNDEAKPKRDQSSIHEHHQNNSSCSENYMDSRFEILYIERNTYHLCSRISIH